MKTRNAMQLKALINNRAKAAGVSPQLTHRKVEEVFGEICAIEVDDDLTFELLRTEDIREVDDHPGIRVLTFARWMTTRASECSSRRATSLWPCP